jgi:hypothetical protein
MKDWVRSDLTIGVKKQQEIMGDEKSLKWLHFV